MDNSNNNSNMNMNNMQSYTAKAASSSKLNSLVSFCTSLNWSDSLGVFTTNYFIITTMTITTKIPIPTSKYGTKPCLSGT